MMHNGHIDNAEMHRLSLRTFYRTPASRGRSLTGVIRYALTIRSKWTYPAGPNCHARVDKTADHFTDHPRCCCPDRVDFHGCRSYYCIITHIHCCSPHCLCNRPGGRPLTPGYAARARDSRRLPGRPGLAWPAHVFCAEHCHHTDQLTRTKYRELADWEQGGRISREITGERRPDKKSDPNSHIADRITIDPNRRHCRRRSFALCKQCRWRCPEHPVNYRHQYLPPG